MRVSGGGVFGFVTEPGDGLHEEMAAEAARVAAVALARYGVGRAEPAVKAA